jgi:hypothetical protein
MAETVYILCGITSLACAAMLLRGYYRTRSPLLFWSGICFTGLAANNILLFVDKVVLGPQIDLTLVRSAVAVVALAVMLVGLVLDAE